VTNFAALHIGALQRLGHDDGTELRRRNVLQAAAKRSDGGAGSTDDDDFTHSALSQVGSGAVGDVRRHSNSRGFLHEPPASA